MIARASDLEASQMSHIHNNESSFPLGTRKSKLAMVQTEQIQSILQKKYPSLSFPLVPMSALGDEILSKPLFQFSANVAKGLWTKELEILLLEKKCRIVVHSLKDLPTTLPDGFKLAIVGEREDPRDAVVMASHMPYKSLLDLPKGSVVGTSSIRRSAQIKRHRPDLQFADVRGNVGTRLSKLDDPSLGYSCLILAAAGLSRLGLLDRATEFLEGPVMYHAPGQGALGIEILECDHIALELLKPLDHFDTRIRTWAERALMRYLQGGCSVPIGVQTVYNAGILSIIGMVVSVDGTKFVEVTEEAMVSTEEEATALGEKLARNMVEKGAKALLDEIELTRERDKDELNPELPQEISRIITT